MCRVPAQAYKEVLTASGGGAGGGGNGGSSDVALEGGGGGRPVTAAAAVRRDLSSVSSASSLMSRRKRTSSPSMSSAPGGAARGLWAKAYSRVLRHAAAQPGDKDLEGEEAAAALAGGMQPPAASTDTQGGLAIQPAYPADLGRADPTFRDDSGCVGTYIDKMGQWWFCLVGRWVGGDGYWTCGMVWYGVFLTDAFGGQVNPRPPHIRQ